MHRLLLGTWIALALPSCGGHVATRPNILIVTIDTLRADRLGCYGSESPNSPVLDAASKGFFLFENAQSAAPWTAPSLTSLMTALTPDVHGVRCFPIPNPLDRNLRTLPEILKEHAYVTAAFTEGGYAKGDFGLERGFDFFPHDSGDEQFPGANPIGPSRLANNVDRTIAWLQETRDKPFFVWFHTYEVHTPYRMPEEFVRQLRPEYDRAAELEKIRATITAWNAKGDLDATGARLLRTYYFEHPVAPGMPVAERTDELVARAQAIGSPLDMDQIPRSAEELQLARDLYAAAVRYTDQQLGRLWAALEVQGLAQNTVVVVLSDHGEGLGDHARLGHGEELHEELLHVPLLMRVPGQAGQPAAPRRVPDLVRVIDVMPTLLELAGIDFRPEDIQGRSLIPILKGEHADRTACSSALSSRGGLDPRCSIRTERWRLILRDKREETELYDRIADSKESRNVAAEQPKVVRDLAGMLESEQRAGADIRKRLHAGETYAITPNEEIFRDLRTFGYVGNEHSPAGAPPVRPTGR